MARVRRQMGLPGGCLACTVTIPNGAGPSTIQLPLIAPNDKCYVVSAAMGVNTAGTGGATATASLRSGSGNTVTLKSTIPLGANTDAAGTYEASSEGDSSKLLQEGDQFNILWTLVAGTNTTGAVYNLAIVLGF